MTEFEFLAKNIDLLVDALDEWEWCFSKSEEKERKEIEEARKYLIDFCEGLFLCEECENYYSQDDHNVCDSFNLCDDCAYAYRIKNG